MDANLAWLIANAESPDEAEVVMGFASDPEMLADMRYFEDDEYAARCDSDADILRSMNV